MDASGENGASYLSGVLAGSPKNWGRFGPDDEVGGLNFLDAEEVLRAVGAVRSGKQFTLGLRVGASGGDPDFPGRMASSHFMVQDKGSYEAGKVDPVEGGVEYAEDSLITSCHGMTHMDGLGHAFLDGEMYNGYDAATTKGGMQQAGILPIAERGVVGRAVLADVARHKGKEHLSMHERVTLEDILGALDTQSTQIQKHDLLIIRTGALKIFYERGAEEFYGDFAEPGITYEPELVEWFHEMEIPGLGTDTLSNEEPFSSTIDATFPMHIALMRNLGVTFHEGLWLEDWARDCAGDGKYDALYIASPLKITRGTASPVNPIAIK